MKNIENNIQTAFLGYLPELPEIVGKYFELSKATKPLECSHSRLITGDSVLQTRIFSYVNTVINNTNNGYISINRGASRVGMQMFKNIVAVFSFFPIFHEFDYIDLFKTSLLVAYISKSIAEKVNYINEHDAFLLGFLHDIGKLPLKSRFDKEYIDFTKGEYGEESKYSSEQEKIKFGYTHYEISSYLSEEWNLPELISNTIKFHHDPFNAKLPQAASILYIADVLSYKNKVFSDDALAAIDYLNIPKNELNSILSISSKRVQPFFEILDI